MKTLFFRYGQLLLIVLFLFSCKSKESVNFEGGSNDAVLMDKVTDNLAAPQPAADMKSVNSRELTQVDPAAIPDIKAGINRKIIKDGNMEIAVKDMKKGKSEIDSMVMQFKGYYSNEAYNNTDYSDNYSLSIRVPSENFEAFIAKIEAGEGVILYKNIASRDVTEEFIDLETRLKNKRNYLDRYNELLKQAKTVKDILEIQENTRNIEEEVESVEGRLKYLNSQVNYSTLDLVISKKNSYSKYTQSRGNFFDRLKISLVKGWFGLVSFFLFIVKIWPFWIILGVFYYVFKKFWRRSKKK